MREPPTIVITLDLTAPTVNLIALALAPGQVQLQWHAHDDASGVARVELQTQQPDGAWQAYATSPFTTTDGAPDFAVEKEHPRPVRMRAVDRAGRVGDWAEIQLVAASEWIYLPLVLR